MPSILDKRRAGVLLHITSLPGDGAVGGLGQEAYHFINFLHETGITVWQTLPLVVTHSDHSPYQSLSAHACNPDLIDISWIYRKGWLDFDDIDPINSRVKSRQDLLARAFDGFKASADKKEKLSFETYCKDKSYWLDDYSLFMALREQFSQQCWNQWPEELKNRNPAAIEEASDLLKNQIAATKFQQYLFYCQWCELKDYAAEHGILLFGDIPIFVSYDSADVWVYRDVFKLNERGEMTVVAGVPPDYFSATGQRWGNPHYNWHYLENSGFAWWLDRMRTQLELFDILRIDHFRGLEAAWEIPSHEDTAMHGEWVRAPGRGLLQAIENEFGHIPLVAEDLGIITREVEELRDDFDLPGMKILQFAFGDGPENPYLPNNYTPNCVVYTGTHDNDTTNGWAEKLRDDERARIYDYLGHPQLPLTTALTHAAFGSVAHLAVIPMQDVLELDSGHRMNTPGTVEGNWLWRFQWDQVTSEHADRLRHQVEMFNR